MLDNIISTDLRDPANAKLVKQLRALLDAVESEQEEHNNNDLDQSSATQRKRSTQLCRHKLARCKYDLHRVLVASAYVLGVGFATAVTMSICHNRTPDAALYPPLPDIFLDNLPLIPWAFKCAELMILFMSIIFFFVLALHQHRWIVFRRFTAITGTVFFLRCITMFVTSLSVPGSHLKCDSRFGESMDNILDNAWNIFIHGGLSVSGVRTCGDYMFSGHTIILTILNYFINEYTPDQWHGLHIFVWLLNCFGMFFILAGHEHYSIDVFVAFYIASRLFLYYHSLANSQAVRGQDGERMRVFFPMFSFLEECTYGIVPNQYEWPWLSFASWWRSSSRSPRKKFERKKVA